MKKYTIVYSVRVGKGIYITRYAHVSCENLLEFLNENPGYGSVWFVFDGHSIETKD